MPLGQSRLRLRNRRLVGLGRTVGGDGMLAGQLFPRRDFNFWRRGLGLLDGSCPQRIDRGRLVASHVDQQVVSHGRMSTGQLFEQRHRNLGRRILRRGNEDVSREVLMATAELVQRRDRLLGWGGRLSRGEYVVRDRGVAAGQLFQRRKAGRRSGSAPGQHIEGRFLEGFGLQGELFEPRFAQARGCADRLKVGFRNRCRFDRRLHGFEQGVGRETPRRLGGLGRRRFGLRLDRAEQGVGREHVTWRQLWPGSRRGPGNGYGRLGFRGGLGLQLDRVGQ